MISLRQICKTYQVGGHTIRALDHVDLEIGLLRAIGARKNDIQKQFLFESATVAGIVFGWYPARKAAELDPIKALHAE